MSSLKENSVKIVVTFLICITLFSSFASYIFVESVSTDSPTNQTSSEVSSNSSSVNSSSSSELSSSTSSSSSGNSNSSSSQSQSSSTTPQTKPPVGSIKFLDKPVTIDNNQTIISQSGCYYVTKISHEGLSGRLSIFKQNQEALATKVSNDYNLIPDYTYLGYWEAGQELVFKLDPFAGIATIFYSTNLARTKIYQYGLSTYRYYFEDSSDNDFNDLVLEVTKGECSEGGTNAGEQEVEITDPSFFLVQIRVLILFITRPMRLLQSSFWIIMINLKYCKIWL